MRIGKCDPDVIFPRGNKDNVSFLIIHTPCAACDPRGLFIFVRILRRQYTKSNRRTNVLMKPSLKFLPAITRTEEQCTYTYGCYLL